MDKQSRVITVEQALEEVRAGRLIIIVDDEDRENEGDLMIAAEKATAESINFMSRHGRGLVCLPLTVQRLAELQLPLMVRDNTSPFISTAASRLSRRSAVVVERLHSG